VEEQFYLMWPAVIVLAGSRRAILVAACAVLLAPIIRVGSWELMRWAGDGIGHRFETVADAIAIGCVLAGTREWLHAQPFYRRALESSMFVVVPLAVLAANLFHEHPLVYFGAAMTVINVGVALCLDWCVTYPEGRVGAVLNTRPLVFIGLLSYSLYLWQQMFLNRASDVAVSAFPLNLLLATLCALASYYVVEQPSLRLRRRIEMRLGKRRAQPTVESAASSVLVGEGIISEPGA
jgi:peptidoglycan/LPS O-acetylase OafA/YrhL